MRHTGIRQDTTIRAEVSWWHYNQKGGLGVSLSVKMVPRTSISTRIHTNLRTHTCVSEVLLDWPFTMHDTEHPYSGIGDKVSVLSAHFQEIIPAPNRNAEKLLAAGWGCGAREPGGRGIRKGLATENRNARPVSLNGSIE